MFLRSPKVGESYDFNTLKAYPIDPASVTGAILIGVAINITTAAIVEGIKALMTKAAPEADVEVTVVTDPGAPGVVHVKVSPKPS